MARRKLLPTAGLVTAVCILVVAVEIAGSAPSEPSQDLIRDVHARLSLLSGQRLINPGDVGFPFLQGRIDNFLESQSAAETKPGTVVNPLTGFPWEKRRLLSVTSGDEEWKGSGESEAAREKQIRAVLDGLNWRLGAVRGTGFGQRPQLTSELSRSAQAETTEKCTPPPAQNPQPPWTSTGSMRGQFSALFPQALASGDTNSNVTGNKASTSASGPPGGDEAIVGISRMVVGLPMPGGPAVGNAPVGETRIVVTTQPFLKAPMNLSVSAEPVQAAWTPDETDWPMGGVSLGSRVPEPVALDPTSSRASYQVPRKAVLDGSAPATAPKFHPMIVIHFAGEEPPSTGWPPVEMDPHGCFWASGYSIRTVHLVYRQALPLMSAPQVPSDSPAPTAEQIAANEKLQKAKKAASDYFQAAFAAAEKGLVGIAGEAVIGTPQGGKDAGQLAKLVGLGGNAPPTKLIAKVAAVFSIVTDVFQIVTYTTAYYAFLQAQDPPAADYDVIAQPAVTGAAGARKVPRALRVDLAQLRDEVRAATAYFMAYLRSFERLQGAILAGDEDAQESQAAATTEYGYLFVKTMSDVAALRKRVLRKAVKAAGARLKLSTKLVRRAGKRVRKRGVTKSLVPFERFGLTGAQAKQARKMVARRIRSGVSGGALSVPGALQTPALLRRERAFLAQIRAVAADPDAFAQPGG